MSFHSVRRTTTTVACGSCFGCTALLCCRVSSRGDWIGPDRRGETDGHRRATGKAGGQGVVSPGEAAGRRSAKCCRTQQPPAPLPHASRQSFPVACCLSPSAATSSSLLRLRWGHFASSGIQHLSSKIIKHAVISMIYTSVYAMHISRGVYHYIKALFSFKKFQNFPWHLILRHMHGVLNINENKN